jgi:hypothetical protein
VIVLVLTDHRSACLVAMVETINLQNEVLAFHSGGLFLANDGLGFNSIVKRYEFL